MERFEKDKENILKFNEEIKYLKHRSKIVRDYISLGMELSKMKKEKNMLSYDDILYSLKEKYILLIEKQMSMLKEEKDVKLYLDITSKISKISENISKYMDELKKKSPALNSWIALNKKKAYLEERISEGVAVPKSKDALKEVNTTISDLRKDYAESIAEWEELYKLKPNIFGI